MILRNGSTKVNPAPPAPSTSLAGLGLAQLRDFLYPCFIDTWRIVQGHPFKRINVRERWKFELKTVRSLGLPNLKGDVHVEKY